MSELDLSWGLGLLAVTAGGVLVVLNLVVGIVLLFRRLFWRHERIATEGEMSALAVLARWMPSSDPSGKSSASSESVDRNRDGPSLPLPRMEESDQGRALIPPFR